MAEEHVVVIGAGIAGLGAAFALRARGIAVTVLEASADVGGRCRSFAWHGRFWHTGAEALMQSERSLTELRTQLRARGAAKDVDLADWDTVHGERLYHRGGVVDADPFSLRGALRLPGGLSGKARLARLLPLALRQRRRHDPEDLTSVAWLRDRDGATYLRSLSPRVFDEVLEPFLQYTTLGVGDYGLAWLIFHSGDLSWTRDWWVYEERGAGGVTGDGGHIAAAPMILTSMNLREP